MKGDKSGIVPIMTNSESVLQFGNNSIRKTNNPLNILRETIMGGNYSTMPLKHIVKDGHSNTQLLQIFLEQWKMPVPLILIGFGELVLY